MVVPVFPSYWLELKTAALTPDPMLLLPESIILCEGNTSTTNFNLFINCLCEISQSEKGNCTVIKYTVCILDSLKNNIVMWNKLSYQLIQLP